MKKGHEYWFNSSLYWATVDEYVWVIIGDFKFAAWIRHVDTTMADRGQKSMYCETLISENISYSMECHSVMFLVYFYTENISGHISDLSTGIHIIIFIFK